jgi:hypothetical protein
MSFQVGVTAVLRISAAGSNSSATASHLPRVILTSFFCSGGASRLTKRIKALYVASMETRPIMSAAANSTPRASYSMTDLDVASTPESTIPHFRFNQPMLKAS